jgi:hypothetical protein
VAHRPAYRLSDRDRATVYRRARRAAVRYGLTAAEWSSYRKAGGRQLRNDLMMAIDPEGEVALARVAMQSGG